MYRAIDRSYSLAVPLHCLGTVDFRCQHAKTEISIPHHWSSRWENWKMICVYVKTNIALINSSLFELLTDSLFNFTFAKSYHKRTLTRSDFSATREKLYLFHSSEPLWGKEFNLVFLVLSGLFSV